MAEKTSRGVRRARGSRAAWCCAAMLLAGTSMAGCGVVWDAPEVRVVVGSDGVHFGGAGDQSRTEGGETIIELMNNTEQRRRLVLAEVDAPGELPPELLDAEFPHDDDRIVDMTGDMRGRRASLTQALQFEYSFAQFHVHLDEDQVYVVFDTLSDDVVTPLWFIPGDGGAEVAP